MVRVLPKRLGLVISMTLEVFSLNTVLIKGTLCSTSEYDYSSQLKKSFLRSAVHKVIEAQKGTIIVIIP